jgi:hypothetical protein
MGKKVEERYQGIYVAACEEDVNYQKKGRINND